MHDQVTVGRRTLARALSLLGIIALWLLGSSIGNYYARIVKLEEMRLPYVVAVFGLLAVFVFSLRSTWVTGGRLLRLVVWGALVGQLASVMALVIANLFLPSGIERTYRSFKMFGPQLLLVDFAVGFALGGWLLGALLLVSYRILLMRGFRQSP
jgi:hypothetical protein